MTGIIRKTEFNKLVVDYDGDSNEYRKTQKDLCILERFIKKFTLEEGDRVEYYSKPYDYITIIKKF